MKKRNKMVACLLAATMILSSFLSGCSANGGAGETQKETSKESAADSEAAASDKKDTENGSEGTTAGSTSDVGWDTSKEDTITLAVINNFYTAGEKKLAEEYMKLHPETKVVVDVISDNDSYITKMMTSMSDDRENAPDIVHGNFLAAAVANNSADIAVDKGYLIDMTDMLDEVNPYNDGKKVREAFDEDDFLISINSSGGRHLTYLPFDKIGVAFYYNKTIFDKLGLSVPTSYENLIEICEKLKEAGYDVPITAGNESGWLINSMADAYYRTTEDEFLVQPGDAIWDENLMKANKDFKFDENNLDCDANVVGSAERQAKYATENGINTEGNKKVWSEFQKLAQYFPTNWIAADGSQIITDFESQVSPILFNGSWNAGLILNDINQLPEDMQFEWATFQLPSFEKAPEGFSQTIRGLYSLGNAISIVPNKDDDHMARVKDFYKYWYSPDQAKLCFEETLANGNYVQGPCVVKGVELSPELTSKLEGFIATGVGRGAQWVTGQDMVTQADKPKYNDLILQFSEGSLGVDSFLEQMDPIYRNYYKDVVDRAGYDLDPTTADTAK